MSIPISMVSACDRNFFWGVFLLTASAARNVPTVPLHLVLAGFTLEESEWLQQFPQVRLHRLSEGNARNVCNRKPEALLQGNSDYIAWIDADCLIVGDITDALIPQNEEFQIRLRSPSENGWVWRNHYAGDEKPGGIPRVVLDQWRRDVGGLEEPRLDTTCVTNAFVLHRRHLDLVRQWGEQIEKVIPPKDGGVVNKNAPAYFMTDESVLSSLLLFSRLAPPPGEWQIDRDPLRHVAHFGGHPKPWDRWRKQSWYCHSHVMELLEWVREQRYSHPPLPWSLRPEKRTQAALLATASEAWSSTRALGGRLLRR